MVYWYIIWLIQIFIQKGINVANFTKDAIKESFLNLLEIKPYNQITVKDVVEECGINRNTFYYHFADLPALFKEILDEQMDMLINEDSDISNLEESFNHAVKFVMDNKKAIYHIYNSINRDIFERYLMRVCDHVVKKYERKAFENSSITDRDKKLIEKHYKYVLFGASIDWLESGMKSDIQGDIHTLCKILNRLQPYMQEYFPG